MISSKSKKEAFIVFTDIFVGSFWLYTAALTKNYFKKIKESPCRKFANWSFENGTV